MARRRLPHRPYRQLCSVGLVVGVHDRSSYPAPVGYVVAVATCPGAYGVEVRRCCGRTCGLACAAATTGWCWVGRLDEDGLVDERCERLLKSGQALAAEVDLVVFAHQREANRTTVTVGNLGAVQVVHQHHALSHMSLLIGFGKE